MSLIHQDCHFLFWTRSELRAREEIKILWSLKDGWPTEICRWIGKQSRKSDKTHTWRSFSRESLTLKMPKLLLITVMLFGFPITEVGNLTLYRLPSIFYHQSGVWFKAKCPFLSMEVSGQETTSSSVLLWEQIMCSSDDRLYTLCFSDMKEQQNAWKSWRKN